MSEQTLEKDVVVTNKAGIHARPASAIVMAVMASECSVTISNIETGAEANGESTMSLLTLSAPFGTRLHLKVTGKDAERLLGTIVRLFETGFGED